MADPSPIPAAEFGRRFGALMARVRSLPGQVSQAINVSGAAEDVRRNHQTAAKAFSAAVESWAGVQANEVMAGKRKAATWEAYGLHLESEGAEHLKQVRDSGGWFTSVLNWIGQGADDGVASLEGKVREVRAKVDALGAQRLRILEMRKALESHQLRLSTEVKDALYGVSFTGAETTWHQLTKLLGDLESSLSMVRGGRARLERDGGDVRVVALSGAAEQVLGAVALVVVAGILGAVAALWALVKLYSRWADHADEVGRQALENRRLDMVQEGRGAEVVKLAQLAAESEKARLAGGPEGPFDKLERYAAYGLGGGLLIGSAIGAVKLYRWWRGP